MRKRLAEILCLILVFGDVHQSRAIMLENMPKKLIGALKKGLESSINIRSVCFKHKAMKILIYQK
jgi:hypothetical protein